MVDKGLFETRIESSAGGLEIKCAIDLSSENIKETRSIRLINWQKCTSFIVLENKELRSSYPGSGLEPHLTNTITSTTKSQLNVISDKASIGYGPLA